MSMSTDFHSQIASIMEALANAAVAEICKVVDDGYAVVQLEMSRGQKENDFLRKKIKLLELQIARHRAEGSAGGRYPGLRFLPRQSRDSHSGPSLQDRTRVLRKAPGDQQSVQRSQSVILDQDPDQEVVTTTKTESAEPEEVRELLIVKVEGAIDTRPADPEDPCISARGELPDVLKDAQDGQPASCSKTEVQGCLTNTSRVECKEERMDTVHGDKETHGCFQSQLEWQENKTENQEPLSCSTYEEVNSSLSKIPPSRMQHESSVSQFDPLPHAVRDRCGRAGLSLQGGGDRVDEAVSDPGMRSQYQPVLCVQIDEPPSNHTFNRAHVAMETTDFQPQQIQHSGSGFQQRDNLSCQNQLSHASSSQNQDIQSAQPQQQEHSRPYVCTFCLRRFTHQSQLHIHKRVHTGEKPYLCPQCGKRFGQLSSLKRHQMVHTGERPFPCPHCGKQFSTSTNLKVHQSVHTGEKRFHCSKCGKNFSFLSNLIRHQALHTIK
ncbi:zinc finger protein 250-like [Parambassis ranga]|uniref:Zinc finger protein 250-like n=1 Tax=Parambassis ranga TaxID=210632 RepID=A0A6P7HIC9_9TELE|nr:zinc finger protein 250-like [Parambassis ranga]